MTTVMKATGPIQEIVKKYEGEKHSYKSKDDVIKELMEDMKQQRDVLGKLI